MQTNLQQKHTLTHIRQSLGNSSFFDSLDLATRKLSHHTAAHCACTHPSGYDPFLPFYFFVNILFTSTGCFLLLSPYRYRRVVYYVSLHSHFPSWADFSFNSCLWPASSRGINHFSFYFEFFYWDSTSVKDIFRGRRALRAVQQLSSKRFLIAGNNRSGHCIRPLYSAASAGAGISITTWANNDGA